MERILTLNSGSSSLKFAVFDWQDEAELVYSGNSSGVGTDKAKLTIKDSKKKRILEESLPKVDHAAAFDRIVSWLEEVISLNDIKAVGHRIVHGGTKFLQHAIIDDTMIEELKHLVPFAANHLPPALDTIEHARTRFEHVLHVGCFDTVFHRDMPDVARIFALPYKLFEQGVERFGFHGLSYEYICLQLHRNFNDEAKNAKIVIAHLGNGCSLAAVKSLKGIDTTMGFSPTGGLVMGTRSGDIDPGLVTYLFEQLNYTPSDFANCVDHQSGLLGLSGISSDMQTLLESTEIGAARAVDVFCYQARKYIAAMSAALDGLDILVFTGGIGENSAEIRKRICSHLGFLGVKIDERKNGDSEQDISLNDAKTKILVIPTNEEIMIARHTAEIASTKTGVSSRRH